MGYWAICGGDRGVGVGVGSLMGTGVLCDETLQTGRIWGGPAATCLCLTGTCST